MKILVGVKLCKELKRIRSVTGQIKGLLIMLISIPIELINEDGFH